MKKFFSGVIDCVGKVLQPEYSISGALIGYSQSEKIHIIDTYNCYGIDAVLKYLK